MHIGIVRYAGAYGDTIMLSSVFAGLREQCARSGHKCEITLITAGPCWEIIKHDPNIDHIIINTHLFESPVETIRNYQVQYDRFIVLQGSIEMTLLSHYTQHTHFWSPQVRHAHMNKNYLEHMHEIAEISHAPKVHFFPSLDEQKWGEQEVKKLSNDNNYHLIGMAIKGSGNKWWYGFDSIANAITKHNHLIRNNVIKGKVAKVLMMGGADVHEFNLMQYWNDHPHEDIIDCCDGYSMRESCTLAQHLPLVIGMDTGLMHSVCQLESIKLVMLTNATRENVTRDWINTYTFSSQNTTCPGRGNNEAPACHMGHVDWTFCKEDKHTGCPQCMADLDVREVWPYVDNVLSQLNRMDKQS
jgi:ADP-heptose:LPS heptosyltransferase